MRLTSAASDYMHAIHAGARGSLLRAPAATYSVLRSRFSYGIGPRLFSLFGLDQVHRNAWSTYAVDEELRKVLRRINPSNAREIVNDKFAFHEHCTAHGIPTIPVLCALDTRSAAGMISADAWAARLANGPARLFIKLINGTWGIDAFTAERIADGVWRFLDRTDSAEELYRHCLQRLGGRRGWIVQPRVSAHSALLKITSPSALSTIRAVTKLDTEGPALLCAALRIPVGANLTDNFAHGRSGNIIAAIDLSSGTLRRARGSRDRSWPDIVSFETHPETGGTIEGFRIPYWEESLRVLIDAQRSLPQLRTVGWDLAITDDGPLIVEANATYDVDLLQVAHGTGMKPVLRPVLDLE